MKYLKLGPKATMFYDPATRILIRGNEVIAAKAFQKSKKLSVALSSGHLAWATEEEFDKFKEEGGKAKEIEKPENRLIEVDPLTEMDPADFKKMVKDSGFSATDQKKILKAEDPIKEYRIIAETYE